MPGLIFAQWKSLKEGGFEGKRQGNSFEVERPIEIDHSKRRHTGFDRCIKM